MRPDHIKLPRAEAAETGRAAAFERKQKWKELPGHRYTPGELQEMSGEFNDSIMLRPKLRVMYTD